MNPDHCSPIAAAKPDARGEPPPTAGAQRTLLAVGSSAKLGAVQHGAPALAPPSACHPSSLAPTHYSPCRPPLTGGWVTKAVPTWLASRQFQVSRRTASLDW